MPYIQIGRKKELNVQTVGQVVPKDAGELNYVITTILKNYLYPHFNYQKCNDCMGALEGAKLELYRRVVAPYEDIKIKTNGDVF